MCQIKIEIWKVDINIKIWNDGWNVCVDFVAIKAEPQTGDHQLVLCLVRRRDPTTFPQIQTSNPHRRIVAPCPFLFFIFPPCSISLSRTSPSFPVSTLIFLFQISFLLLIFPKKFIVIFSRTNLLIIFSHFSIYSFFEKDNPLNYVGKNYSVLMIYYHVEVINFGSVINIILM